MSHSHERKEKICLNCGTALIDRYCQYCGQENVEPKESLWHLLGHVFNDITHFDGKFFSTIKLLITKPGFLSEEYVEGRRVRYLHPVRMYLFLSFVLFLLAFSIQNNQHVISDTSKKDTAHNNPNTISFVVPKATDSIKKDREAKTVAEYDSIQSHIKPNLRDGWLKHALVRRKIASLEYAEKRPSIWIDESTNIFKHSLPKMLFISVPLFATLLWLLYIRKRKKYYFVAHGVFAMHLYCAMYLFLIFITPFDLTDNSILSFIENLLIVTIPFVYLFLAMRRFYKQSIGKTLLKMALLTALSFAMFVILFSFFFLNAILSVGTTHV
ncbi:MAG: DUF3667 domain-containing protein [Bacteroidetes bacterium]|nr:DUF3667 domain-containing protein [Bacteroidota bacterium]